MAAITNPLPLTSNDWYMASIIARREVRDTLRDWRLVIPILGLTLFFPGLMTLVAQRMTSFLAANSSMLLGQRAVPLLLMVVGFFPTSFSLVIALEAFVGEKERKSLEPLLSTPLSNKQLYLGKLMASVIPPVLASYVGIALYTLGVTLTLGPMDTQSVILIIVLTTVQAILMVSASVIISSQTTSVRAANLLASFIVVPVALLLQGEAVLMVYQFYFALWWVVAGALVSSIIFMRMGIQLFDREQLLGRDIDYIRFGWAIKLVWNRFTGRDEGGNYPSVLGWYRKLFAMLPSLRNPIYVLLFAFAVAIGMGAAVAYIFPLPEELLSELRSVQMQSRVLLVQEMFSQLPGYIFSHNIRAIALITILGTLSLGVFSVILFMLPWSIIAFAAAQFASVGESPFVFVGATVLPHAWVELPALLLVIGAALRWQATIIAPPTRGSVSERWLEAGSDFFRILFGLGVPLFLAAALLESYVTPAVMVWVYG